MNNPANSFVPLSYLISHSSILNSNFSRLQIPGSKYFILYINKSVYIILIRDLCSLGTNSNFASENSEKSTGD